VITNYERTAAWLAACGKEPNEKNLSVQIGCHLEEFAEFLTSLHVSSMTADFTLRNAAMQLEALGNGLKKGMVTASIPYDKRVDALDALCDTEVTGNGVAYMARFIKPAADEEVLASNEAKLVDGKPVLLEGGKIGKPEGWKPPNLEQFV
jgi:hypothetical protein